MLKLKIYYIFFVILLIHSLMIAQKNMSTINLANEAIIIDDPLNGSTIGNKVSGFFNSDGYSSGIGSGHILYDIPIQIPNGYAEFEIKGFNPDDIPLNENHGFLALYDGRGIAEPIKYFDDFKHNYFRWNVHWRQSTAAFKAVIACADPTAERINSTYAVYEDKNGDGLDSHDRDWYDEPNGNSQSWNVNSWYTIKVQWNNKNFEVFVNGVKKWSVSGPNDYNPIDFRIWLGSSPGKYDSDVNVTYRNFKLVSFDTGSSNFLDLSTNSQSIHSNSGNFEVNVVSNIEWVISENLDWLSIFPISGSNNGSFQVSYDENPSTIERMGEVIVSGSVLTDTLLVTQEGAELTNYLFLLPEVDSVSSENGNTTFSIMTDLAWTINDTSSWASVDLLSGIGNSDITVSFNDNSSVEERSTQFLLESAAGNKIFTLVQSGFTIPNYLLISPEQDTVDHESGSGSIVLESNLDWTVSDDAVWLSKSPIEGVGDTILTFNFVKNSSHEPRIATITVVADTIIRKTTIVQNGTPFEITVSANPEVGGTFIGVGSYHLGDSAIISAIPNSGWRFLHFIEADTIVTYDSVYSFLVYKSQQLIANFEFITSRSKEIQNIPVNFSLGNNYPNPFNPSTTIIYSLPKESDVSIVLYDMLGNRIKSLVDQRKKAGVHSLKLKADNLSSGAYYYQMRTESFVKTKKLLFLK